MNVDKNRKEVAALFKKRTGVEYQNWIQALSVSSKPKRLALALLPKWIALVALVSGLLYFLSCTPHTRIVIQDYKGIEHKYLDSLYISSGVTETLYCGEHHGWEMVSARWGGDSMSYYISRRRK